MNIILLLSPILYFFALTASLCNPGEILDLKKKEVASELIMMYGLAMSSQDLSTFKFWVQYAVVTYCLNSYLTPAQSQKPFCPARNCLVVERASILVFLTFTK
jgi:hypothetical protein